MNVIVEFDYVIWQFFGDWFGFECGGEDCIVYVFILWQIGDVYFFGDQFIC